MHKYISHVHTRTYIHVHIYTYAVHYIRTFIYINICMYMYIHCTSCRSNSTGSIMSLASIENGPSSHIGTTEFSPEDSGPSLESYIEAFILTLMTLNYKRTLLPAPSTGLLALSLIIEKLGDTPQDKALKASNY